MMPTISHTVALVSIKLQKIIYNDSTVHYVAMSVNWRSFALHICHMDCIE